MCICAEIFPSAAWTPMRAVTRPARDAGIDGVPRLGFEHFQLTREVHGNFGLAAVDRA